MIRLITIFFLFLGTFSLYGKCSTVPASIKDAYASNMHHAFWLQAHGQSSLAFLQFQSAYEQAKKAGENILRIIAVEQLFIWYRTYASSLNLYVTKPTGNERIQGEYRPTLRTFSSRVPFQSEWGKTPEQAQQVRNFMVGVGEVISGIFCATVSSGWGTPIAAGLIFDGVSRMYSSLDNIWTAHQALISLKEWEQGPLKLAQQQ
jgi:hypothetical protein